MQAPTPSGITPRQRVALDALRRVIPGAARVSDEGSLHVGSIAEKLGIGFLAPVLAEHAELDLAAVREGRARARENRPCPMLALTRRELIAIARALRDVASAAGARAGFVLYSELGGGP